MARDTSAFRADRPATASLALPLWAERRLGALLSISVAIVTTTSSSAPPTANQPIEGCSMKISTR